MQPSTICEKLGPDKVARICEELNSAQLKTTLRKGGLSTKAPSRMVSQKARRKLWGERLLRSLEKGNDPLAESLLYEWLLHHRRNLLILYLDRIGVKHTGGETEETFTRTVPPETLVQEALSLAREQDPVEVAAYVHFLDYHQESQVYAESAALRGLLEGMSADEALRLHGQAQAGAEDAPAADPQSGDAPAADPQSGDAASGGAAPAPSSESSDPEA